MHPEHRSIGELAYRLWQARGCPQGSAERDWLDAEKQLKGAQRTIEPRATASRAAESTTSNAIDSTLKATFPASDPPASQRADEPPANADAKWKAAADSRKAPVAARPRQPKSTQGKPGAKPPG
jgi:LmbE family N-acetylglucosaminyl deacetylase